MCSCDRFDFQPADIYEFGARYFSELIEQRDAQRSEDLAHNLSSAQLGEVILGESSVSTYEMSIDYSFMQRKSGALLSHQYKA